MESAGTGFLLLVVAGVMNASFALPMKFTRRWAWENTWAVWTGLALLLMPLIGAAITVPQLPHVYAQAGTRSVVLVAACGMGWGIAQVLFGLAVDSIGIALAFAIVLGLSAAIGGLIPFLRLHADKALTPAGLGLIGGVLLVMVGVGICARAGTLREQTAKQAQMNRSPTSGILIAVMRGIGAASMNFGVAFGGPVVEAAAVHGANPAWRMNAGWLRLMTAGAFPDCHGDFLVCQHADVWRPQLKTRCARPGLRLATLHVPDCDRFHRDRNFGGRMEERIEVCRWLAVGWSGRADNGCDRVVLRGTSFVKGNDESDLGRSRRYTRYHRSG